jgi:Ni/Co efflux regulator RcnB
MHTRKHTLVAALVATLAVAPALAGPGHGKGHGNDKHEGKHAVVQKHGGDRHARRDDDRHGDRHARRDDARRLARNDARRFAQSDTRVLGAAGCPPGLAKKDNGCLPPGQAKKLAVGHPIPAGAVYTIPPRVLSTLPAPPVGYRYAIVGNQVVLVSSGDIVVDIIRSLLG